MPAESVIPHGPGRSGWPGAEEGSGVCLRGDRIELSGALRLLGRCGITASYSACALSPGNAGVTAFSVAVYREPKYLVVSAVIRPGETGLAMQAGSGYQDRVQ